MGAAIAKISDSDREQSVEALKKLKSASFYEDLDSLQSSIEGTLLLPNSDDIESAYQEARSRPYNLEFRGFPLIIARPKNASDVAKFVNFVREKGSGIPLAVQCGGHSTRCMITDSFTIDLVNLKHVQLDKENMLIHVGGGAYLKEIDDALKPHGLGTPVGTYPLTGVGGLVLAGGYGFLSRTHGMSVDNLREVEVVLADGRIIVANDSNEYKDLIWGCRGGGGNFGIVTKFTFAVHKLPPSIFAGMKVYLTPTFASAKQVYKSMDTIVSTLPREITTFTVFPGADPVVPTLWVYFGDKKTVVDVPALNATPAGSWLCLMNTIKPADYHSEVQTITQPLNSPGHYSYTSLVQIGTQDEELPETFFDEMLTHTRNSLPRSLKKAAAILFNIGGEMTTADDGTKTAINGAIRQARYFVIVESVWNNDYGEDGRLAARNWVKEVVRICDKYRVAPMLHAPDAINDAAIAAAVSLVPTARTVSKNAIFSEEASVTAPTATTATAATIATAAAAAQMKSSINLTDVGAHDPGYAASILERLGKVKGIYDPTNFFRQNANILPTFPGSEEVC